MAIENIPPTKTNDAEIGHSDPVVSAIEGKLEALEQQYEALLTAAEAGKSVGFSEYGRTIDYDREQECLITYGRGGQRIALTWGDIRSAMLFGVEYRFGSDQDTSGKQLDPQYVMNKKAFLVLSYQERKQYLEYLKVAYEESQNPRNRNHADEAYTGIYESMQKDDAELERGRLAEKMLLAYLIKYFSEHPDEGYPYDPGPVMDVEYRIDLMIQVKDMQQQIRQVAVQFSTDPSEETFLRKDKEVRRGLFKLTHENRGFNPLDSFYLIQSDVVADIMCSTYRKWRDPNNSGALTSVKKCDPRGPFALLTDEDNRLLMDNLKTLLDGVRSIRDGTIENHVS